MMTKFSVQPAPALADLKTVAVVVPGYNRSEFTADEEVSFRQLETFLGPYDKFLVVPRSLSIRRDGFALKRFDDAFFGSAIANTRLLLSRAFYESFAGYRYILLYQLDALVFSDQLLKWCAMDLDYIGAPWVNCEDSPWVSKPRVGNGGLSLRKVESFLKVLSSDRYWIDPEIYWRSLVVTEPWPRRLLHLPKKWLKRISRFNGVTWELRQWHLRPDGTRNEDHFWADHAVRYFPDFKVASFEQGLRFAFEVAPRHCFKLNGRQLPFGCHAWTRYDRAFWESYLIQPRPISITKEGP
jgi:Protein of unknown function (DUF5672)